MNQRAVLVWCAFLLTSAGCLSQSPEPAATHDVQVCFETGDCVAVEIADDAQEQARGLMYRQKLAEDQGMLFVFDRTGVHKFWMKNTLIPLDMLWIAEGGRIIHVEHDVPPCKGDPCPSYGPDAPAKYVLEVNAGYARKQGIDVGDQVLLPQQV